MQRAVLLIEENNNYWITHISDRLNCTRSFNWNILVQILILKHVTIFLVYYVHRYKIALYKEDWYRLVPQDIGLRHKTTIGFYKNSSLWCMAEATVGYITH